MGTRLRRAALLALALLVVAPLGVADAKTYDLPALAAKQIAKVNARSSIPVLLPDSLALDYDGKLFVSGGTSSKGWHFDFDGAPDCGGANACFLASVSAEKGGTPAYKRTVKLAGGVIGYFKPLTCGGSCSPPVLQFVADGVLYEIAAKVPDSKDADALRRLKRAANQALAAGERT